MAVSKSLPRRRLDERLRAATSRSLAVAVFALLCMLFLAAATPAGAAGLLDWLFKPKAEQSPPIERPKALPAKPSLPKFSPSEGSERRAPAGQRLVVGRARTAPAAIRRCACGCATATTGRFATASRHATCARTGSSARRAATATASCSTGRPKASTSPTCATSAAAPTRNSPTRSATARNTIPRAAARTSRGRGLRSGAIPAMRWWTSNCCRPTTSRRRAGTPRWRWSRPTT